MNFRNKNVLVTGGTGMIGRQLVELLLKENAKVTIVSLDSAKNLPKKVKFIKSDLREFSNCLKCCKGKDIVFHLAGIKGSPKMAIEQPASFMVPTVQFSFNMLEAARKSNVKHYLFTSSVGVYNPRPILKENDVWKTFPSKNDWFAGWAKRLCELQVEAFKKQYNKMKIYVVRPANVYGPHDNFDKENAMVIPSIIKRALSKENPLVIWGDGSAVRDFIFSKDVARGMIEVVKKNVQVPVNLGSGKGCTIKTLVSNIVKIVGDKNVKIFWDKKKPTGDKKRILSMNRMKKIGFHTKTSLQKGLEETINWYIENKNNSERYNSFIENKK